MTNQLVKNLMTVKKQYVKRPLVSGTVLDRYLFNFRVNLDTLEKHMPTLKWLEPRNAHGYGVVSLCMILFKGLTIQPFPMIGINTVACAYRYSVMDVSGKEPVPTVYLIGRNTDSTFANYFGPLILSSRLGKTISTIKKNHEGNLSVDIQNSDTRTIISATILHSKPRRKSVLFESTNEFKDFMSDGLVSYTPGLKDGKYARCDFEGAAFNYEQIDAKINESYLEEDWCDEDLVFDSAYKTINVQEYNLRNKGVYNGDL